MPDAPKIRMKGVEMVAVADLKRHPKNPNHHSPDQVERLAQIIEYQGWRYAIKVSRLSGYITAGHGRLDAALLRGWTHVPVSYQEYESVEQEYADLVADNSIAEWSELDLSLINSYLPDLGPDFDIDMLGLKSFEIDPADLPSLPDGERSILRQMAFQVTEEQETEIKRALSIAKDMGEFVDTGNSNSNGNAIARIVETFLTEHGTSKEH